MPLGNIRPTALHKVPGEVVTKVGARARCQVFQRGEVWAQQTEQVVERILIAAVGCGCQQHHVARRVLCQTLEQLVALLSALTRVGAGVCLVNDDEFGAETLEGFTPPIGLDVVQADHGERVGIEHRRAGRKVAL